MSQEAIEAALLTKGFVSIKVAAKATGMSSAYLHRLMKNKGVAHEAWKHAFYPLWSELRAAIPIADALDLPLDAGALAALTAGVSVTSAVEAPLAVVSTPAKKASKKKR